MAFKFCLKWKKIIKNYDIFHIKDLLKKSIDCNGTKKEEEVGFIFLSG